MIEKALDFVAETIGGNLVTCDNGYVIESYVENNRVDYVFGEDGKFLYSEIKGFAEKYSLKETKLICKECKEDITGNRNKQCPFCWKIQ